MINYLQAFHALFEAMQEAETRSLSTKVGFQQLLKRVTRRVLCDCKKSRNLEQHA